MRSLMWEHFTVSVNDDKKAVCKYCNVSVSRGGKNPKTFGTTNLSKHLGLNHASEYTHLEASKKAREIENKDKPSDVVVQTLNDYVQKMTPFGLNHPTARKITRTVGEMIALDNQPFSIVDDLGFKNLMRILEPRYNLPSRHYFAEVVIPDMYVPAGEGKSCHILEAARFLKLYNRFMVICGPGFHVEFNSTLHLLVF